jgi:hypothetical protein
MNRAEPVSAMIGVVPLPQQVVDGTAAVEGDPQSDPFARRNLGDGIGG